MGCAYWFSYCFCSDRIKDILDFSFIKKKINKCSCFSEIYLEMCILQGIRQLDDVNNKIEMTKEFEASSLYYYKLFIIDLI